MCINNEITMKKLQLIFLVLLFSACAKEQTFEYPVFPKSDVVDDYHGTPVADPWRWLEDPNSDQTKSWVTAQNEVTMPFLASLPGRETIINRLTDLWDFPRYGSPSRAGENYFYYLNDGLQNQSVLYKQASLDADATVLIDPNTFSEDGTVALSSVAFSENAKYVAYAKSVGGSDWREFFVRDVNSGEDLADHIEWVKFSGVSWDKNEEGFYYGRFPQPTPEEFLTAPNRNMKLYYHKLGTSQDEDVLVYERPDQPDWGLYGQVTDDGNYLVINISQGTDQRNRVYVKDLTRANSQVMPLLDAFDASYSFIDNNGTTFYFRTNNEAPKYRVIAVDVRRSQPSNWTTVIAEGESVLTGITVVANRMVASYLTDARSEILIYGFDGTFEREIELPTVGSAGGLNGRKQDNELFYSFASFTYPSTIFRYDFTTNESVVFRASEVDFNPDDFETRQVFYDSKDGTKIPMFITHKKGLELDGSNPTYLYGYGGFNISMTPGFSVGNIVWLEQGGIYAVANLRGGGEYGREWHLSGTKERKQNVFDDFIAAAEYLIEDGYTSSDKLSIGGGSNGGLLVAAAILQRPDLFGAALPAVGVLDMLRYHQFTIGWAWASDYGTSEDPEGFEYLYAYSPLHNVKDGVEYPSTLITTADRDDRVVPAHSFKFAAELQEKHGGKNPVLIRIETDAGHGAGKPTSKIIEELADRWAFLANELGMKIQ
jgi:prolyl oligopeptidase